LCRKVPTTPFHIVKSQQDDSSIEGLIGVAIDVTSSKTSIKKFSSTNGTAFQGVGILSFRFTDLEIYNKYTCNEKRIRKSKR
jgi:hypothetical protein